MAPGEHRSGGAPPLQRGEAPFTLSVAPPRRSRGVKWLRQRNRAEMHLDWNSTGIVNELITHGADSTICSVYMKKSTVDTPVLVLPLLRNDLPFVFMQ